MEYIRMQQALIQEIQLENQRLIVESLDINQLMVEFLVMDYLHLLQAWIMLELLRVMLKMPLLLLML